MFLKGSRTHNVLIKRGLASPEIVALAAEGRSGKLVKRSLAASIDDADLLNGLALDADAKTRRNAMRNPACPEEGQVAAALLD